MKCGAEEGNEDEVENERSLRQWSQEVKTEEEEEEEDKEDEEDEEDEEKSKGVSLGTIQKGGGSEEKRAKSD